MSLVVYHLRHLLIMFNSEFFFHYFKITELSKLAVQGEAENI